MLHNTAAVLVQSAFQPLASILITREVHPPLVLNSLISILNLLLVMKYWLHLWLVCCISVVPRGYCSCVSLFRFLSVRSNGQVITAGFNEMDFTQTIKHTNSHREILCMCLKATPPSQTASKFQGSEFSIYWPWVDKRSNACKVWVFQDTVRLNSLYSYFLTHNSRIGKLFGG